MNNEEAIKILDNIEEEITPEKFNSMDEYLTAYQKRFIELFGVAKDEDPEAVKEARSFLEIGIVNKERDEDASNILDFSAQKNRIQLLKYYTPEKTIDRIKGVVLSTDGFIEMEYDQILEALTCSGNN